MQSPNRPRILIADDHTLVAEGIAKIISPMYEVVGIAPNGRVLLDYARQLKPDLACLDVSMPEMNGIQTAVQLAEEFPKLRIIFVTQQLDLTYVRAAFRAGASGYVSKQSASNEILSAIQQVLRGGTFITPLLGEELLMSPDELARDPRRAFADPLTDRQRQVLQLIAEGRTIKEMSDALSISPKTVEFHKSCLMNELGLRTTAELTRYAVAHNIVSD